MSKVKKYLFIASALTLFSVFSQEVQGEVWSNTVGYQTIQLQEGRNFVGLNFKNPEGDSYNVQELLDTSVLEGGLNRSSSDQLIVWDTVNQKYIRLWLRSDGTWIDTSTGVAAEQDVHCGDGFWLIRSIADPVEVELSGEIESVESFTHAALEGRNLLGSAWPVDVHVNDEMDLSGLEGGLNRSSSDQLIVWDTENQKYIRLWLRSDGIWIDTNTGRAADRVIPAGAAFWVIKQTSEELTETKPF